MYINTSALRSPRWRSAVSTEGQASNAALAVLGVAVLRFVPADAWVLQSSLTLIIHLQVIAVALCMLPIPPLDGYGVIEPLLTPEFRDRLAPVHRWGMWAVILTLWYIDPVGNFFWGHIHRASTALGLDPMLIHQAWTQFHFWKH